VHNPALSPIPQCALQKDEHAAQAENNRDVLTLPGRAAEKHTQRGKNSVVKKNALYTRSQPDRTITAQRPRSAYAAPKTHTEQEKTREILKNSFRRECSNKETNRDFCL